MKTDLLIGGEWVGGAEGDRIDVLNPATGEVITDIAAGTPAEVSSRISSGPSAMNEKPRCGVSIWFDANPRSASTPSNGPCCKPAGEANES